LSYSPRFSPSGTTSRPPLATMIAYDVVSVPCHSII
jgi:hypothetical protein